MFIPLRAYLYRYLSCARMRVTLALPRLAQAVSVGFRPLVVSNNAPISRPAAGTDTAISSTTAATATAAAATAATANAATASSTSDNNAQEWNGRKY